MAERFRAAEGGLHHHGADPLALGLRVDRERPEQQRGARTAVFLAGLDVPEAQRADEPPTADRREGEAAGGPTPLSQALGGLGASVAGEAQVEQALARGDVVELFGADLDHARALPGLRSGSDRPRGRWAAPVRCGC